MTTKTAVVATVAIVLAAIAGGFALLWFFVDPNAPGAKQRSEMLGQGLAFLTLVPLFIIWVLWAARFRQERERKQQSRSLRR